MNHSHEEAHIHTGIMRLALATEDARAYWSRVVPGENAKERLRRAFEERWFGGKSEERVAGILRYFYARFDAFPESLPVLGRWREMAPDTRRAICHWHLQLSDPLYRELTGAYLPERRSGPRSEISRYLVLRWLASKFPGRWSSSSAAVVASKLLSAAHEAGLVASNRDPRPLVWPRVPDHALLYLLHLLRGLVFEGTLLENPYLASVGLTGPALEERLRKLPGVSYRRMGALEDLQFEHPTLTAWAAEVIS
ncbi:DUF1819 domain-containing protein [Vulgatibacter incomptus]|uniref:DUF1819 domain-containing protein n=1 Tax=Vulgatibacter incomptus TaxID=1391653 RepID=A0A0K1PBL8_9BACT|nr:DUF1819 domain-containing protein [Vulgatibacter incomptus]AKU90920.1 hypothetical protein AKJ08_1307 [Vulgatibacter incomptus]